MVTICAWCPTDAPPMWDDGKSATISHGICQAHLFEMRQLLREVPRADDVPAGDGRMEATRD